MTLARHLNFPRDLQQTNTWIKPSTFPRDLQQHKRLWRSPTAQQTHGSNHPHSQEISNRQWTNTWIKPTTFPRDLQHHKRLWRSPTDKHMDQTNHIPKRSPPAQTSLEISNNTNVSGDLQQTNTWIKPTTFPRDLQHHKRLGRSPTTQQTPGSNHPHSTTQRIMAY